MRFTTTRAGFVRFVGGGTFGGDVSVAITGWSGGALVTSEAVLGAGGGGLSGPAIHPVTVRTVYDVHAALPDLPIVGVGGVADGRTAVELLLAGASAVQVGTANFYDPRAAQRLAGALPGALAHLGARSVREVVGTLRP